MDQFTTKVKQFHDAFGLDNQTAAEPRVPPVGVGRQRCEWMLGELEELVEALDKKDKTEILDALLDIQYFLSGTVLACGMQDIFEAGFDEVHRSNMAKLGPDGKPILDEDGRVVKPEGWQEPDLERFVEDWNW